MGRQTGQNPMDHHGGEKTYEAQIYREDESFAIGLLATEGSVASFNYSQMGLNRALLKSVFRALQTCRRQQVVFAQIICATKYKYFDTNGTLREVDCPNKCGAADSFTHMLSCYGLGTPNPTWDFEDWTSFFRRMAIITTRNCPMLPVPKSQLGDAEAEEIELSMEGPSNVMVASEAGALTDTDSFVLEFDNSE